MIDTVLVILFNAAAIGYQQTATSGLGPQKMPGPKLKKSWLQNGVYAIPRQVCQFNSLDGKTAPEVWSF
jgi:hypothetical protein